TVQREVDADHKRASERGHPEPQHTIPHWRHVSGVEHAVRAHPRIEVLVERLDADDGEHDASEATPEGGSVERAADGVGPGRAEEIRQGARLEGKPVTDHAAN